ncbi:hypothetical protein [Streptomyces benahoarensis]|uniref:ScoMcrA-like SRA domain-containing protein n=1 Tax=Streptomyces benahoarensis TaxID=2595054 RepID=A0A553ZCJ7_9ACTN|nr:hypothetical protein [Streptomyces benahoarensis]TSB20864.1 hypothetical protein FNJ62_20290 [Streptomyces benahoarensis]TSB39151.1 hypothetical protein FNZ23_16000 [Streptomyces benahoarensis]
MADIPIKPGQLTTRAEMQRVFGGGEREGIVPSTTTPSILIYTDHDSGKEYGYQDGWLAEEDDHGPIFEYTGRGRIGDQTFLGPAGSRNKAILRHVDDGRVLHLFIAAGKIPGSHSDAKQQRYLGEFQLDADLPYTIREASDPEGNQRRIIVFRLRPSGSVQHAKQDVLPAAEKTHARRVSANVSAGSIEEPAAGKKTTSLRSAQPSTMTEHRQTQISQSYREFLNEQQHEVFAYQIKIAGTTSILKTDLYDATDHILYAIKGSSDRQEIRMAIGQLKDYCRHIDPPNPTLAVLVPEKPNADLIDLLERENIKLVHQDGEAFAEHHPTQSHQTPISRK